LLEELRNGEIDCAILAEPFPDTNLAVAPATTSPSWRPQPPVGGAAAVTAGDENHAAAGQRPCFRDHVLEVCPGSPVFSSSDGIRKSFEGSSLKPSAHGGCMGITLVPPGRARRPWPRPQGRRPCPQATDVYQCLQGDIQIGGWCWCGGATSRGMRPSLLRNAIYACRAPGVKRL
jgi:LysR family hydrogen peroxide-inducible transcriptional activator